MAKKRKARADIGVVEKVLGELGSINANSKGGLHVHLHLKREHGPMLILPHVTQLKILLPSFVLTTHWRSTIKGIGRVYLRFTYPHSENICTLPKYRVNLPYYLSNSRSLHETNGKYFIVSKVSPEHPHDDIGVRLTIRANNTSVRYATDLDLVGIKDGKILLAEVLNGKVGNIKAALIRKSEIWSALRSVGVPVDKVLVYVVTKVPEVFKREYLAEIIDMLKRRGFTGTLWITNRRHSKHEEFSF